ncbi:helix-turn-helix domain-containing protein [Streptomyces halstedii]|uniref:Helix-turn-helix domain-containing protein n=1 Tax=Streptomyces halstedii TaxID=1944 RepID=A0ABS6TV15_STRHA|nr:helix-turn-helix transcriptional regulator [Streptomyces halstedii]MBV7672120.1 helix-turn-helix domain-containing protein [Streptomyces halstedii]
MVRTPLTPEERRRGERLGELLRLARGPRSMVAVAASAGISAETLRKIETGRAPTPAFFTVAALAGALGLTMDDLLARCTAEPVDPAGPADRAEPPAEAGALPLIA